MRCEVGTVLRAPPGLQPRFYEPFVIVDAGLRLQAVSHHAEAMLRVDTPAAIDVPLAEFLACRTDKDQLDLAGLVGRAVGGSRPPARVQLRTADDPAVEVVARVAGCGPPPAAVLTLTLLRTPRTRLSERAAAGHGRRPEPRGVSYSPAAGRASLGSSSTNSE